jgi:hypothetical protein
MSLGRRHGSIARSAALIALAALGVHQLRYLLAYGGGAHGELARQGHDYLFGALPILAGFAIATLAAGLLRAAITSSPSPALASARTRAVIYAAGILAVFVVQETTEGVLFAGHASGFAAAVAAGGWLALPLALAFGSLCTLLDGGLALVERSVALAAGSPPPRRSRLRLPADGRSRIAIPLASRPLQFGLARRPPPVLS